MSEQGRFDLFQGIRTRRTILDRTQRLGTFTADIVDDYDVLLDAAEALEHIVEAWDPPAFRGDRTLLRERIEEGRAALRRLRGW